MWRNTFIVMALIGLIGCSASTSIEPLGKSNDSGDEAKLAAYAATTKYPADLKASDEWRVGALVDRKTGGIQIINFGDKPITDAKIWVNGAFVSHAGTIPPAGYISIGRDRFYDAAGDSLSSQTASVTRVQVQAGEGLYNVLGPVMEDAR